MFPFDKCHLTKFVGAPLLIESGQIKQISQKNICFWRKCHWRRLSSQGAVVNRQKLWTLRYSLAQHGSYSTDIIEALKWHEGGVWPTN